MVETLSYDVVECESGVRAYVRAAPLIPEGPLCSRCGHPPCEMCRNGWCDTIGPVVHADDGVPIVVVGAEPSDDADDAESDADADVIDNDMCCDGECAHVPELLAAYFAWADRAPTCSRCRAEMSFHSLGRCAQLICSCARTHDLFRGRMRVRARSRARDSLSRSFFDACGCRFDPEKIDAWVAAYPTAIAAHNDEVRRRASSATHPASVDGAEIVTLR